MASNRYEILARLAAGGMAELYLARATAPDGSASHVVLKRILPSRSGDPQFVTMFLDEARLAAQLHHPNIAQVFDIGRLGSSYFFTMEYVHGENARAVLQREYGLRRKVPIGHAITIAAGAATGLHHAHDATSADRRPLGIVHRDVSPANIMVSFDGAVKLVDFGVAKAAVRFHETRAGTIKGKIAYLSPEQCTGNKPVDRRSDVFSLGIVLYELLTVQRLFRRDSDFATMAAIVTEDVPPPSVLRSDIPPELDAVVMTALSKQPEDRYPSAGAMVDALERAASASGVALSVAGLGRYLRELFGVRPEPWVELDSLEQHPALLTVTGESMIQIPIATPLGPAATMWPGGETPPPQPLVGEVAEIEAALVRTVRLEAVPQPDDDDFLATRPESGIAARARGKDAGAASESIEDRPTMIDERAPEMPSDLDEPTPHEPMDPVMTPPTARPALPRTATPPRGSSSVPPPVPVGARGPDRTPPPMPGAPPVGSLVPMPPVLPPRFSGEGEAGASYNSLASDEAATSVHHSPPGMPVLAHDDPEPAWSRDTHVEGMINPPSDGPTMRRPTVAPPPGVAPGSAPMLTLRTKLMIAAIGMIVVALIIRAAAHHGSRNDEPEPVTEPAPGLPPP
jgi:serine/threonine protein kinase